MDDIIVEIRNCNCIKNAKIKIKPKSLNLKYGPNGTGKSTISKAIFAKANNKEIELSKLKSYYKSEMPYVRCDNCNLVRVFNEDYVNSYLFTEKSFLGNSFQVFLQSEDFDKLLKKTTLLLEELQSIFEKSESINGLKEFLPTYFNTMKFKDGSLSQRGGVGELIKGYGYGFENHSELKDFSPYFHDRDFSSVSKWAKWRNDGTKQIYGELCPFCTHLLDKSKIKKQNEIIAKVFKSSALTTANALLDFLDHGVEKGYINIASVKVLKKYFGDDNKSDELLAELNQIGNETDYLCIKIQKICSFRPMNISSDKLKEIESILDDMCIDGRQISKYYSTKVVNELVDYISKKIIDLRQKTGLLKGLFIQCQKKMDNLINDREEDINHFFGLAGFPYKFIIKNGGENKALSYLVPLNLPEETKVEQLETHLSWGEKNAFSLVMFMFETVIEDVDLIILDDPISSFDNNKKFSVIRRMFDNQKNSFRDKTVVMLTHDMQPIIDYVYGNLFWKFGLTTPVQAMYLTNEDGTLKETEITKSDLVNTVELTKKMAKDPTQALAVRVVNLRRYIELTNPNFTSSSEYEILSNIIHGRFVPLDKDKNTLLDLIINEGLVFINDYIPNVNYKEFIDGTTDDILIQLLSEGENYTKIIAIRYLFEKERPEKLLSKLKNNYPGACKFVNEINHIENDYIFQLNPLNFFEIPQFYIIQLENFLKNNCGLEL